MLYIIKRQITFYRIFVDSDFCKRKMIRNKSIIGTQLSGNLGFVI